MKGWISFCIVGCLSLRSVEHVAFAVGRLSAAELFASIVISFSSFLCCSSVILLQ